jgi:nitrite reductase/ring-hydroxylating ferredoxin subunit
MTLVKVAKTFDALVGKMKHVEVEGLEILIANVEGKFYAVGDRCPHLNGKLSEGALKNTVVICPRHLSSYDVTTGRVVSGTHSNLLSYDVKVDGEDLLINI